MDGLAPPEDVQLILPVENDQDGLAVEETDQLVLTDEGLGVDPLVILTEVPDFHEAGVRVTHVQPSTPSPAHPRWEPQSREQHT